MGDGPQYYFVLKSDDHDVIATSKMYSSKQDCQTGIASVQRNGPTTDIRDETV
nr:YegP family protein [Pantoea ananatis]